MHEEFHADGETWQVSTDPHDIGRDVRTVVFHCVSNSSRPYRVVEVPDSLLQGREFDSLNGEELRQLFDRTHTMDFSHDAAANPESHGFGDPPLG